jgi:polygalacturonase
MTKKLLSLAALALFTGAAAAQTADEAWKTAYPEIEKNIKAPTFREKDYNIQDFGAVANDSAKLNHPAINLAIATCSGEGGGRVVVPAGVWHTGPIVLKSNVNLYVAEGATLLFTTDTRYYPNVLTRWEGVDCYSTHPLVYAFGETNIGITVKGTIDGGGANENWWRMCGAVKFGWEDGVISQRVGRPKLLRWNEDNVPLAERIMTPTDGMRPQLVNLYKCSNILIEDVTLLRSPFWVLHPLLSNNITVRGVHIQNAGPNGDGCDPESCSNVLIENCFFDTGDDCIAIKSGRNGDGRRWSVPSENIIVRNCTMKNGHGGVVIGSEISGGYRNLFVENCIMDSPLLDRVIRIKTSTCRGGLVENVYVRNIKVGQCKEAVLKINLVYENRENCDRSFPPVVRNVYLDNVTSTKSRYGVMITALEDLCNVYNINVTNSKFDGVADGNFISGQTKDVNLKNLYINGKLVK